MDDPDDSATRSGGGWALPDAPADSRPSDAAAPTERPDEPVTVAASPPTSPVMVPVPLTALTLTQRLDGAWNVLTCAPGTVVGVTAAVLLPAQLLMAGLLYGHPSVPHVVTPLSAVWRVLFSESSDEAPLPALLAAAAVINLAYALLGGAISTLVAGWYQGRRGSVRSALVGLLDHLPAIGLSWLVLLPLRAAALAVCGGAPIVSGILAAGTCAVVPAIVFERLDGVRGIARSFRLTRPRLGELAVTLLLAVAVEALVYLAAVFLLLGLTGLLVPELPEVVANGAISAVSLVTAPVMVGVCIVSYLELRVRREGLDLDLEAVDVFGGR